MVLSIGCLRQQEYPGVAKFGIALEWGSRGLEFESRHSDQKSPETVRVLGLFSFARMKEHHRFSNTFLTLSNIAVRRKQAKAIIPESCE